MYVRMSLKNDESLIKNKYPSIFVDALHGSTSDLWHILARMHVCTHSTMPCTVIFKRERKREKMMKSGMGAVGAIRMH